MLLQQGGTQVDQQDEAGRTPLALAATRGHADCVHTLLSQGASPSSTTTRLGQTAVHHAGGWLGENPRWSRVKVRVRVRVLAHQVRKDHNKAEYLFSIVRHNSILLQANVCLSRRFPQHRTVTRRVCAAYWMNPTQRTS